ncbi:MAG: putative fatty-acid--CoA ligase [Frankiales bacterium]|nr:putative fatty-acid--CoA ligase [Frankiales bacterium]
MIGHTLGERLVDNATRFAGTPAYVCDGRVQTHGELLDRATRLASALAQLGVRRQDRVALLGRNSIEYGEVLAAGRLSGTVVATVNFRLAPPEVAYVLGDIAPAVVIADAEYVPMLRALPEPPELIVSIGGDYEQVLATGRPALPYVSTPEDIAHLIYTSGTTGKPKGCILGQRETRRMAQVLNDEMRSGCDDRILLVMPLFHVGAMAMDLGIHARGGTSVLHRQFDTAEALTAIEHERITMLHLAPPLLQQLLDTAEASASAALTGVQTVVYSAAPMTSATLRQAMAAMPGAGMLNLYGQTEVITSGLPREMHRTAGSEADIARRLGSVGFPYPDVDVRIVDEEGRPCPTGSPGEIIVRTEAVTRGYWNDGPATTEALRDGWFHTGDVGTFDHEGLLHLVDRLKDVVNTGGEKVYSREVEEAVLSHPSVSQVAVIGVPDRAWGESVCAVVVAAHGSSPDLEELAGHVRTQLARYKAPRRLVVVAELPLLPTGKIDKKRLRAELSTV